MSGETKSQEEAYRDALKGLLERAELAEGALQYTAAEADRLRLKAIEDALRINNLLREVGRLEDVVARMQQRAVAAARVLDVDTCI